MPRLFSQLSGFERQTLAGLQPFFRDQVAAAWDQMAGDGYDLSVPATGGVRSTERQGQLYADSLQQGGGQRLAYPVAYPGSSKHEVGLAMDIQIDSVNGVPVGAYGDSDATDQYYQAIGPYVQGYPDLKWGGSFNDPGHVEWRAVRTELVRGPGNEVLHAVRADGSQYNVTRVIAAIVNGNVVPVAPGMTVEETGETPGSPPSGVADVGALAIVLMIGAGMLWARRRMGY